jgi:ABC-2 type transport system ATP-binding protein
MPRKRKSIKIIDVKNLTKSYGKIDAVKGVSFQVAEGEIFGLLGPNGAGKTTILEILEGLQTQDRGTALVLGLNPLTQASLVRQKLGIVFQQTRFFPDLSLLELLELFASFYENPAPLEQVVERFELKNLLPRQFSELSGGQRQRFILATSLLHHPSLLFLDEPTSGLDPAVRQKTWELISSLKQEGLTILLTTHYMEEAEILCDRVGILDYGKLVACGNPIKLINSCGVKSTISFMSSKPINVAKLEQLQGMQMVRRDRYSYSMETEIPEDSLRELLEWEKNFPGKIFNLQVKQATLEEVFLKLTGHILE